MKNHRTVLRQQVKDGLGRFYRHLTYSKLAANAKGAEYDGFTAGLWEDDAWVNFAEAEVAMRKLEFTEKTIKQAAHNITVKLGM